MDLGSILEVLDSSLRLATPLLFACLAGLYSERAGIFDIGLEGKMLGAAFAAGAFAAVTGSAWIGLLAGIAASGALAALHGFASISLRGNQIISGVAINFLASGMTALIGQNWFHQGGQTPQLLGDQRFRGIDLPLAESLGAVPILGPIYRSLVSGHNVLVYLGIAAVPLTWWILFRTRFGLRLRAVGENPGAVDTAGISVVGQRYAAVMICGLLCGFAGAYLATGMSAGFVRDMTAGKGFIALAALIFAKWRPWQALGACLLFGFLEAIGIRYQNIGVAEPYLTWLRVGFLAIGLGGLAAAVAALLVRSMDRWLVPAGLIAAGTGFGLRLLLWQERIPVQFMQALPYILTVVILAGFVGKAIPPKAGGRPYVKER